MGEQKEAEEEGKRLAQKLQGVMGEWSSQGEELEKMRGEKEALEVAGGEAEEKSRKMEESVTGLAEDVKKLQAEKRSRIGEEEGLGGKEGLVGDGRYGGGRK